MILVITVNGLENKPSPYTRRNKEKSRNKNKADNKKIIEFHIR